ncbi:hypothetical protein OAA10_00325 [bacterium]|nr:hypothetical protein [bacterium]
MNGRFNEEALAAIELEKDLMGQEVVITDDFSETEEQVMELKRQVFDAICKSGLSDERKEQAFNALTK